MPAISSSILWADDFNLVNAYLAAKMCQASYENSSVVLNDMKTALGATGFTAIPRNGIVPPVIVWNLPGGHFAVSWAGIQYTSQFLAYVALSMTGTGTNYKGRINRFLKYCVDQTIGDIVNAMGGGAPANPAPKVFIAGHSAGGGCATALANRLIFKYGTAFDVKAVYAIGSPKTGDEEFVTTVSDASTSTSMRVRNDPVCTWPSQGSGLLATAIGATIPGVAAYAFWNNYRDLQVTYEVAPTGNVSMRRVSSHGQTGDSDALILVRSLLETGNLPESHNINTAVNILFPMAAKYAFVYGWTNANTIVDATYAVPATVDLTQGTLGTGSLPPISQFRDIPTLPAGATARFGGGVIQFGGGAGVVNTSDRGSTKARAKKGDGHTKKRVKEILSRMKRVDDHDWGVFFGQKKSSRVLLNHAKISQDEWVAWDTVRAALERVVAEWDA